MKTRGSVVLLVLVALLLGGLFNAAAQGAVPSVTVADQLSLDGTVTVASAYSAGPGFIVIHADGGQGAPGPVIGHRALNVGWNYQIEVPINALAATPTLFAMLHEDTGQVGVYEFAGAGTPDGPVSDASGQVITPPFAVNAIFVRDQFLQGGLVTLASVTAQVPGWLVVHADNGAGAPGPVLGQTQVRAGTTVEVNVSLSGDATAALWPMLHVDDGTVGTYEFAGPGTADGPVVVDGQVATLPIWTVPHVRVPDQIIVNGDNTTAAEAAAPSLVADSVLAEVAGWLVVHADNAGAPGPVIGFSPVPAGTSVNVAVDLDATGLTPVLWPMLHVDDGVAGTYEFAGPGTPDGPVIVDDQVLTFPITVAPSLTLEDQALSDGQLIIASALMDAPGWIAVHNSTDGAPGPVIANFPVLAGLNRDLAIPVDPAAAGSQVFPMLHYDTGAVGVYEFAGPGTPDPPVFVSEVVVVGPLNLTPAEGESAAPAAAPAACTVSPAGNVANLRQGPGTNFAQTGTLSAGTSMAADGQITGADGFIWWRLENGSFARSDVVAEDGACDSLPVLDQSAVPAAPAPAAPPAPAATEESGG